MASIGGGLTISVSVDSKGVSTGLNDINRQVSQFASNVETQSNKINVSTGSIVRGFAAITGINLGIQGIKEFGQEVLRMTGLMQGLSLSFETMLGNKMLADEMMSNVKQFALDTPYTITETATIVKQLIAMNAAGNDVMETYKALGDVAAGLNVPISRIAINFGQVAALGRLQQREIRDFAMAGVPIFDALSKSMGKSTQELMAMSRAGQIGFEDTLNAFKLMSAEGGRFAGMMGKMNSTVMGQMNRLQDQIEQMFAQIGQANTGFIYAAISGASSLVTNYKAIIAILGTLIGAYGAVKAAEMVSIGFERGAQTIKVDAEIAALEALIGVKKQEANEDLKKLVVDKKISASQAERLALLRAEMAEKLRAAQIEAAAAKAEQNAARLAHKANLQRSVDAKKRLIEASTELEIARRSGDTTRMAKAAIAQETAVENVSITTKARKASADKLSIATTNANTAALKANTLEQQINNASKQAGAVASGKLAVAGKAATDTFKGLGSVMKTVGTGLLLGGLISMISSISKQIKEANALSKELTATIDEENISINAQEQEFELLYRRLQRAGEGTREFKNIRDQIVDQYPTILKNIGDENGATLLLTETYKKLKDEIVKAAHARAITDIENKQAEIVAKQIDDSYAKIAQAINAKFGEGTLESIDWLNQIKPFLHDTSREMSAELRAFIDSLTTTFSSTGEYLGSAGSFVVNPVLDELAKIDEANLKSEQIIKQKTAAWVIEEQIMSKAADTARIAALNFNDLNYELTAEKENLAKLSLANSNATEEQLAQQEKLVNMLQAEFDAKVAAGNVSKDFASKQVADIETQISNLNRLDAESTSVVRQKLDEQLRYWQDILATFSTAKVTDTTIKSTDTDVLDSTKKINDAIIALNKDRQDAIMELMQDGIEKEKLLREINYNNELDEVRQHMIDLAVARNKGISASSISVQDTPESRLELQMIGFDETEIDNYYTTLENKRQKYNSDIAQIEAEDLKRQQEEQAELIRLYGDYEDKKTLILLEAELQREKIRSGSFTEEQKQRLLEGLESDTNSIIADLQSSVKPVTDAISDLFDDMRKKSSKDLRFIADEADAMMEFVKKGVWDEDLGKRFDVTPEAFKKLNEEWAKSPKAADTVRNKIEEIRNSADELEPVLAGVLRALDDIFSGDLAQSELNRELQNLQNGFQQIAQIAGTVSDIFNNLAEIGGGSGFSKIASGLSEAIDIAGGVISSAATGAAFGGGLGAAVGAGLGLISGITGIFSKNAQAVKEMQRKAEEAAVAFKKAEGEIANSLRYEDFDNIFGTNAAARAQAAYRALNDTTKELTDTTTAYWQLQTLHLRNAGINQEQYNKLLERANEIGGRQGELMRKSLESSGAITSDIMGALNMDDFFNFDGTFKSGGLEGLKEWLRINEEYLDPEEKEVINGWILMGQRMEEATEAFTSHIKDLFSDMANSIASSMIDSFKATGNAMSSLEDIAQQVAENMANATIQKMLFEKYLTPELEQKITEAIGIGDYETANSLWQNVLKDIETSPELKEALNKVFEIFGIKMEEQSRTSASQGIAQASQDSIDYLTGVWVNIENNVYLIKEAMLKERDNASTTVLGNILTQVSAIRLNTNRLEAVENYLRVGNSSLIDVRDEIRQLNR